MNVPITFEQLQHNSSVHSIGIDNLFVLPQLEDGRSVKFLIVDNLITVEIVMRDLRILEPDSECDGAVDVNASYTLTVTVIDNSLPNGRTVILDRHIAKSLIVIRELNPTIRLCTQIVEEYVDGVGVVWLFKVTIKSSPVRKHFCRTSVQLSCPWILYGLRVIRDVDVSDFLEDVRAGLYDGASVDCINGRMKQLKEYADNLDDECPEKKDLEIIVQLWDEHRLLPTIASKPTTKFINTYHPRTDAEVMGCEHLKLIKDDEQS